MTKWISFDDRKPKDDESFLGLFNGNDVCEFLIIQCSEFEGRYYPDHLDGIIDFDDAVNPKMWSEIK